MPSTESRWAWKPLLAWLAVGITVAVLLELTLNDVLGRELARDIGTGVVFGTLLAFYNNRNRPPGTRTRYPVVQVLGLALVFVLLSQALRWIGL